MVAEPSSTHITSQAREIFSCFLAYLHPLLPPHDTHLSQGILREEHDPLERPTGPSTFLEGLPLEFDLSSMTDPSTPSQHLVDTVRRLKPFLPSNCQLLGPSDLKVIGSYAVDGGGFAEIWICQRNDGTTVVIKALRYYSSSSRLPAFLRLYKEALVCSHLNGISDTYFAPFLGIYSSRDHPFALVFEYMDHRNLGEYLKTHREAKGIELFLQVARGLRSMHNHGVIHGNLKIENILVDSDGHARIGGLGTASLQRETQTADIDRFFHGAAPEVADPQRWSVASAGASKESDVYALGVLLWQVFSGQAPFSDEGVVAGVHSMSNGRRPARPSHPDLSDRMWKLINGCWKVDPAERKTINDVIDILEEEVNTRK